MRSRILEDKRGEKEVNINGISQVIFFGIIILQCYLR